MSQIALTSSRHRRRKIMDKAMTVVAYLCALAAIVPLALVLIYVAVKGLGAWSPQFFTGLPQLNTGYFVDGSHAEYAKANARYVVRVPEGVNALEAAPLNCAG